MKKRKLKPQVKAVLIILGVIASLILLENIVYGVISLIKYVKVRIEYNDQVKTYQSTQKYQTEKYIAECVNQAMQYINSGDYETLYNLLDPDYKEAFSIDSLEKFKNIVNDYIGDSPEKATLVDHALQHGRYICDISIYQGEKIESSTILIKPLEDNKFYIILDEVETIEKFNGRFTKNQPEVNYNLVYRVIKGDERILVLEITNKTSKDLSGSFANTKLQKTDRKYCVLLNKEEISNVTIPAGESIRLNFVFSNKTGPLLLDDSLYLNFDLNNGTKLSGIMEMTYEYWE